MSDYERMLKIKREGYAGVLSDGKIVDRREYPDALPLQKNDLLGIPKPKPVSQDDSGENND